MTLYSEMLDSLRSNTPRCTDLAWRRGQLTGLLHMLDDQKDLIVDAIHKDLKRSSFETTVMEVVSLRVEIVEALNEMEKWVEPVKVKRNLLTTLDNAYTQSQPLGVVLILGAWNFPFQVTLIPLVGALAAGNCVVVKPSEISSHSCSLMNELLPQYLDGDCIKVVMGGATETTELLKEKFDHIFYTGSTQVGKIVYKAAAENLTPVTLELGGKSPVIVDSSCDIATVAKRIMWGKLVNCGQTCIAPDYVLVEKPLMTPLVAECRAAVESFHGGDSKASKDYGRIISPHHFNRLQKLLSTTEGTVKHGTADHLDPQELFIPPILLADVALTDVVMQEEIFGPILPFMGVDDMEHAIRIVNSKPHPLVIYLFTKDADVTQKFTTATKSGGLVVNDTLVQMSITSLPFGGVGDSGFGSYHGKKTFDCFSHQKSIFSKKQNLEFVNELRYPPYSERKLKVIGWVLDKKVQGNSLLLPVAAAVIAAIAIYLCLL